MAAALIGPAASAIARLLGGTGLGPSIARGAVSGVAAVGAADLLKALEADLGSGHPDRMATARRVPRYAIVDLHNDSIVRTLSAKHVYSILTHPRRRGKYSKAAKLTVLHAGDSLVSVK